MPLGLFPRETMDALQVGNEGETSAPPSPGFFAGSLTAIPKGVVSGGFKITQALADPQFTLAAQTARMEGQDPNEVLVQQLAAESGDPYTVMSVLPHLVDHAQHPTEQTPDEFEAQAKAGTAALVNQFRLDPKTVGFAGQTLGGISDAVVRFAAGGPEVAGLSEFVDRKKQLTAAGVDDDTANRVAVIDAAALSIGGTAPMSMGKTLLARLGSGAAVNAALGGYTRVLTSRVLDAGGYQGMAQQYRVLDTQAMLSDAVLGMAFGLQAHLVRPSAVDAALTSQEAVHLEDAAPGAPTNPGARDLHVEQMVEGVRQLLNDEPVTGMRMPETVPNPAQDAAKEANAGVFEAEAREALGEPVEPPREERRQDAMDAARMMELRTKPNRTPAETEEYMRLLEADRLAAKVGGRRIQGVLNDDAYAEMLQRGEQLPVQGFIDLDMLKALNDTYGHATGDEAIRTLGETLSHYFGEGNVFRRSSSGAGDEFLVQSRDLAAHGEAIAAARRYLDNHVLRAYGRDGNVIAEKRGIGFSHGSGKTAELAEQAAYADKQLRKQQGLRSDRGAVDTEPAAGGGQNRSHQTAGAKTEVGPVQATAALTRALVRLRDSNGTDEAAHAQVREIVGNLPETMRDAVEQAAIARAGEGAEEALAGAKATESPRLDVSALDTPAREAIEAAQRALEERPDMVVPNEAGTAMPARDALAQALEEIKNASGDDELHKVAAACFGRV